MARRALGPATLAAVQAVDHALTSRDERLLVACSGGADSLALAVAAIHVGRRRQRAVAAVVVDHQLQADSAAVADATAEQLGELGCENVRVEQVTVRRGGQGLEAAARTARYGALNALAESGGATLLLGHTLDDQAETVLLGLVRGSGLRSLAGMAERTGHWLRPFLSLRRRTTVAVCAEAGLEPWQDPQNSDVSFARARVRHEVLPSLEASLGPGIAEALARTAILARDDTDLLEVLAEEADPGTADLDCAVVTGLPVALRRRVLLRWLRRSGAHDLGVSHLSAVDALITDWHGQGPLDLPAVSVGRHDGRLWCRWRGDQTR